MLDWIEGRWVGEIKGQFIEEIWSEERVGHRHAMFRWHRDDKPWLYEWMLLGEFEGEIQIRLKHFGVDAVGWEEKDAWTEFTLVAEEPNKAIFQQTNKENAPRIVYHRIGDEMQTWFEQEGTPPPAEDVFRYRLVPECGRSIPAAVE